MRRHSIASIFLSSLFFCAGMAPRALIAQQAATVDPYIWLEDVDAKKSMDWVNAHNASTVAELTGSPLYQPLYTRIKQVLDSKDRIAYPNIIGDKLYNFWQDTDHQRGIWRRSNMVDYLAGNPKWETVLDLDAMSKADNVTWSWGGADCLEPANRYCLVSLSRGGSDAAEVREMDVVTRKFMDDGFKLSQNKTTTAWLDTNTLLVGTDFGANSFTTSGYPRVIKLWKRGTPLSSATTVFEVPADHVSAGAYVVDAVGRRYVVINDGKTFYEGTQYLYDNGKLVKFDIPADADLYLVRDQMIVYVRDPWTVGGTTWGTGSLVATSVNDFLAGKRDLKLVMKPGPRETINRIAATRDYLLMNVLNNVRGELRRYSYKNSAWTFDKVPAPDLGTIGIISTSTKSNQYFFNYTSFIQPTTLFIGNEDGAVKEVKRLPAMFDANGLTVEQLEATSKDGTKIPFFVVHRETLVRDGNNPTLLSAYGGFEYSNTPAYGTTIGSAWLERGGVYVLANIRGGGEFGPQWHRAGLKENRQRIYDDFTAVSEELIRQRITSPAHLGIVGGSNGGLLVGVAFTERPDLYNAVVIQNPLLDMQRYSHLLAGASWMAEYGDPDKPDQWAYISKYSPYQNVRAGVKYPKVMFTTTTRDDRVHPAHARKMAAKMEAMGYPFYYFENTEGGHGSGVTNEERAKSLALTYTYLWKQLGG
ncbi:MAG: prolyl oligopeptidase family serine peptidase [Gemmatimonadota bacterium]|nr:prolyl oligopeptidase family serine peptidase [Gemmatimonadota bacterium]